MKNNEDSSFLQGVEGRLDSLLSVENEKKDDNKGTSEIKASEDFSTEKIKAEAQPALPVKEAEDTEQSKVISEIEKRFNAIFGEDDKEVKYETKTKEQHTGEAIIAKANGPENNDIDQAQFKLPTVEEIISNVELTDSKSIDQLPAEFVPSSSQLDSPLKAIKNIIISLEWQTDSGMLDQFDAEINKLQAFNEGNSTILGFLQILRFLGRYIRVKGTDSNRGAIALLLSVYDNLEDVMLSEGMTAENKRAILLEDIKNYREWAEQIDFEVGKDKSLNKQYIPVTREINYNVSDVLAAIKQMTPHEAIAYVLVDFKKAISAEINTLRSEIQRYNQPK